MKRGQINPLFIILTILIIITIFLIGYIVVSFWSNDKNDNNQSKNLTRIDQIEDAIEHSLNQTDGPSEECNDECSARGLKEG